MFSIVKQFDKPQFLEDCPVLLRQYRVLKDDQTNSTYLQLLFENLGNKTITSLSLDVYCYDQNGFEVQRICPFTYEDISFAPFTKFGKGMAITLQNQNTMEIKAAPVLLRFIDSSGWKNKSEKGYHRIPLTNVRQMTLYEQFERDCSNKGIRNISYMPAFYEHLWICTCGALNSRYKDTCKTCGTEQKWLLEHSNSEYLEKAEFQCIYKLKEEEEAEKRRKEEQARIAEKQEQKRKEQQEELQRITEQKKAERKQKVITRRAVAKKRVLLIGIPIALIIALVMVLLFAPFVRYGIARTYFKYERFDKASRLFETIPDYDDSQNYIDTCALAIARSKVHDPSTYEEGIKLLCDITGWTSTTDTAKECRYQAASDLLKQSKYEEAILGFAALAGYSNSSDNLIEAKYQYANWLISGEQWETAVQVLTEIIEYKDCQSLLAQTKYQWANSLIEEEQLEFAIQILSEIKNYQDSKTILNQVKIQQSQVLARSGKYEEAIALVTETGRAGADTKIALYYQWGISLMEQKNYSKALECFEHSYEYEDTNSKRAICQVHTSIDEKDVSKRYSKLSAIKVALLDEQTKALYDQQMLQCGADFFSEGKYVSAFNIYYSYGRTSDIKRCTDNLIKEEKYKDAFSLFKKINDTEGMENCNKKYIESLSQPKSVQFSSSLEGIAQYLSISSFTYSFSEGVLYFTIEYSSTRSYACSAFNPPNGTNYKIITRGATDPNNSSFSFKVKCNAVLKDDTMSIKFFNYSSDHQIEGTYGYLFLYTNQFKYLSEDLMGNSLF